MSIAAFLLVSVFSLLVCYYVLAWFGHMGDFMNLKLPGLPPPKAAPATVSNAAMSHVAVSHAVVSNVAVSNVAQTVGQWLAHWS